MAYPDDLGFARDQHLHHHEDVERFNRGMGESLKPARPGGRRGALTHVGSAVVLALAAAPILTHTLGGLGRAPVLEDLSRGLLALIGLWFLWRAWRGPLHEHREGVMVGVIAGLVPCPLT